MSGTAGPTEWWAVPTLRCLGAVGTAVGEDFAAGFSDGDGVLEMGGRLAVFGHHRPFIFQKHHFTLAHDHHGLDRYGRADFKTKIAPKLFGGDEIGDLGLFVHAAADAVADELADDRKAVPLDVPLDQAG